VYLPPPGYPQPGTDPNAGLPSSSRPTTNAASASDGFDLDRGSQRTGVVTGAKGSEGSVTLSRRPVQAPAIHTVRKGDTLWDLCARYYDNPYNWPKIWSYNPQIQNPHWIYPGDELRMRGGGAVAGLGGAGGPGGSGGGDDGGRGDGSDRDGFGDAPGTAPGDTVFLRDQGFIGDAKKDVWGELVGAREDQMLLSEGNHVYMLIRKGAKVRPGQRLTIFRAMPPPEKVAGARRPPGQLVTVKGTVRVDQFDPKTRVARGQIVESVDVIERGAQIGPVGRRFEVTAPKPSNKDLWARVLGSAYPHVFYGQNQVVFIDRGSADGLTPGNRLFVVQQGDAWRHSLQTATRMARDRVAMESSQRVQVEHTPLRGDEKKFPEEIIGELRVLRTEKYSSLALVTVSHREIVAGDRVVARKGY
jgi:hypothetical protein